MAQAGNGASLCAADATAALVLAEALGDDVGFTPVVAHAALTAAEAITQAARDAPRQYVCKGSSRLITGAVFIAATPVLFSCVLPALP